MSKSTKCTLCGEDFPSRNQLFKHLERSHGNNNGGASFKETKKIDANDDHGGDNKRNNNKLSKGNDAYYKYYLQQKICNDNDTDVKNEQSWKDAYRRMRTPLPISYRIHESNPISEFSVQLLELLVEQHREQRKSNKANNAKSDDDCAGELASGHEEVVDGDDELCAFQEWSFNTNIPANNKRNISATNIPKLRMTVTPNFHRRNRIKNRSSNANQEEESGTDDAYSPILHALQELGAIHRQELVSAIPPLALWAADSEDDKGSHDGSTICADLCAAPGSKSLQLLDMLYTTGASGSGSGGIVIPSGLLVVNDSDRNRIITLCQRSRHVPRAPMLSLNMDARYFPGMRRVLNSNNNSTCKTDHNEEGTKKSVVNENNNKSGYKQKYDKVLCDVPCSGDGTTRKNKQVWNTWSIAHAMSLHRLQRKILRRAMELLRPGGNVVYSTCSLNPLEDEAVVASVIADVGGIASMEIVSLPEWLVQKCGALNGLQTWQVPNPKYGKNDDTTVMYQCFDDVPVEHQGDGCNTKGKKGGQINRSMFPCDDDPELSKQLRHCRRFLPNDQLDSGGFFVACIKRRRIGELEIQVKNESSQSAVTSNEEPNKTCPEPNAKSPNICADDDAMASISEPTAIENKQCLREGDWICTSCKEMNFEKRGRCYKCKAKKPKSMLKKSQEDSEAQRPLLAKPLSSVMEAFYDFFGITSGLESSFPLNNIRFIYRAKETVMVLVSDALSKLAISEAWSPVRELGITLATFPNILDQKGLPQHDLNFELFDEGLHILTQCATRRHFKLEPTSFRNALAQSVRTLMATSSGAKAERVKATLDRSSARVDFLCDNEMWYDTFQESMSSMWMECKKSPGYFIVSCECSISSSQDSVGSFSFCGCIDAEGVVTTKTSLRVAAAMLVVLHKYLEVVPSCANKEARQSKRSRLI